MMGVKTGTHPTWKCTFGPWKPFGNQVGGRVEGTLKHDDGSNLLIIANHVTPPKAKTKITYSLVMTG